MIKFYNDHLAPPELCRMLHEVVPSRYHLPLRFHNRRQNHIYGERARVPCGALFFKGNGRDPSHIDINLNPIYGESWRHPTYRCAPSTALWYGLLEVCLHEFGHVATRKQVLRMNRHEYSAEFMRGRVFYATEHLAREWQERSFERILRDDPRLGQPAYIRGYFGARLAKWSASARWSTGGCDCSEYIKEVRCRRSGAQLTAGDVLRWLEVDPERYTNAYKELLHASTGIGVEYTDGAGRRHRLYTWGDAHLVARRFRHDELRERPPTPGLRRSPQAPKISRKVSSGTGTGSSCQGEADGIPHIRLPPSPAPHGHPPRVPGPRSPGSEQTPAAITVEAERPGAFVEPREVVLGLFIRREDRGVLLSRRRSISRDRLPPR